MGYTRHRRAEPSIVRLLLEQHALEPGGRLLDVGAGTGNYSRALAAGGLEVLALEPTAMMRRQAEPSPRVCWLAGRAEQIPLRAASVDATLCMLSAHHFSSLEQAGAELDRVCPRGPLAIFTFDPRCAGPWWFPEYFPTIWERSFEIFPPLDEVAARCAGQTTRAAEIVPFLLPPDPSDRFAAAGWRQPELYLDPTVRAAMSPFALADQEQVALDVDRLRRDLESGALQSRYGALLEQETYDAGYRLIVLRSVANVER